MHSPEKILTKNEIPEDKLRKRILTEPQVKRFLDDLIKNPELKELEMHMVGGIVRDTLLGESKSKDFDFIFRKIERDALEEALQNKKGNLDLVGKNFGVYKYTPKDSKLGEAIDIAFPRVEFAAGTGGKKDFDVQADPDLPVEDDLGRRDLTINAMAYDVREGKLVDPYNGQKDLENKIIRAVGNPNERFKEDYSRMLRAIRFACRFDFEIEPKTWEAIVKNVKHFNDTRQNKEGKTERIVPEDTIRKEMLKALQINPLRAFDLYDKAGIWEQLIPELNELKSCEQSPEFHSEGNVWTHTRMMLEKLESEEFKKQFPKSKITPTLIMSILLHDIGKPSTQKKIKKNGQDKISFYGHENEGEKIAGNILRRLKFSKKQIEKAKNIISGHMLPMSGDPKKFTPRVIKNNFIGVKAQELLQVFFLDLLSSIRPDGTAETDKFDELIKRANEVKKRLAEKKERQLPKNILSSDDIKNIFPEKKSGPFFGIAIQLAEDAFLEGKINTRKQAVEYIQKNKTKILEMEREYLQNRKKIRRKKN